MSVSMLFILLQSEAAPGGSYSSIFLIGAMVLVFWFFMIRPQTKKAKDQKKFLSQIEKGDKIVTLSGMHGTIHKLNEDGTSFIIEVGSSHHLKMERSAISLDLTRSYYPKPTLGKSK